MTHATSDRRNSSIALEGLRAAPDRPLWTGGETERPILPPIQPVDRANDFDVERIVIQAIEHARIAQSDWIAKSLQERLRVIHSLRMKIGRDPRSLAEAVSRKNMAETLAAEVLPLADACRFLELHAKSILRERKIGSLGRPSWLWGAKLRLRREPFGIVLIIGPSNYPLMLPGIQVIQALTAGNAVLLKPGAGGTSAANALVKSLVQCGVPGAVLQVLPETPQAARFAIKNGIDQLILTGSVEAGRSVGIDAADRLVPTIMELSGCDAVFVLDDADPELVCDCLLFGLTLNHGQTCIAPRRVFASDEMTNAITTRLLAKLSKRSRVEDHSIASNEQLTQSQAFQRALNMIDSSISDGATLLSDSVDEIDGQRRLARIAILDRVRPEMEIVRSDPFAPVVSFLRVNTEQEAIAMSEQCAFALGASVFGTERRGQQFANQIDAGVVVINDLIAATADPRIPFGGRRDSGHGVSRGAAGLEAMTQWKAIVTPRRWFRPHLESPTPVDADVIEHLIKIEHAESPLAKLRAIPSMLAHTFSQWKFRKSHRRRLP